MMWMMRCYGRWHEIMRRDSVDLQMQNYEQSNATVLVACVIHGP